MIELIVFNHLLIFTPRNNKDTISLKHSIFYYLWQYIPLLNKFILIISVITFFVFESSKFKIFLVDLYFTRRKNEQNKELNRNFRIN